MTERINESAGKEEFENYLLRWVHHHIPGAHQTSMEVTSLNIQWFPQQRGIGISISKLGMWPRALILATRVWDKGPRDLDTPSSSSLWEPEESP